MRRVIIGLSAVGLIMTLNSQSSADCDAILRDGLFNKTNISESADLKKAYSDWMCSTEFKTHDEAIAAGISVGVPVYGVPLKIGGNFLKQDRDSFYKNECSQSSAASEYQYRRSVAISQVADSIVNAWSSCKAVQSDKRGVQCALSGDDSVLTFAARHYPIGAKQTAALTSSPQIVGASCTLLAAQKGGDVIPVGGEAYTCERRMSAQGELPAVTININTTQGNCSATAPKRNKARVISGNVQLTGTTTWTDDAIRFTAGARIIVSGGGSLIIKAKYIEAPDGVYIDGTGDKGPSGAQGESGGTPANPRGSRPGWDCVERTKCSRKDYDDANSCRDNPRHADNGRPGENGGVGGIGANIQIRAERTKGRVTCHAPGGPGGAGGPGGFPVTHTFRGRDPFSCLDGAPGMSGTAGRDGTCDLDLNTATQ